MTRSAITLGMLLLLGSPAAAKTGMSVRSPDTTAAAARIAAAYGVITSTHRSVEHNRAVGGVPNSYHLYGRAIDVARRPGTTHHQIEAALRAAGFALIESLDEGDHSHFAFGPAAAATVGKPIEVVGRKLPKAETPPPPKFPTVLADEHGTLLVDLQAEAGATRPAAAGSVQIAGSAP